MQTIDNTLYRKAFMQYLRKGTPIERSLQALLTKAEHPTTHYIWRTQGDDKVRSSHVANNGKIFAWNNPPDTGHPSEEFGCRCWAEPVQIHADQMLLSQIKDNPSLWSNADFVIHYFFGNGTAVTLSEIGYMQKIIDYYSEGLGVYERVNLQIIEKALDVMNGNLTYPFENSYDFGGVFSGVKYSFGEAVVSGVFEGTVSTDEDGIEIIGKIIYLFHDSFSDPTSKVEDLMEERNITRQEALAILGDNTDEYGIPYSITESWVTEFRGLAQKLGR